MRWRSLLWGLAARSLPSSGLTTTTARSRSFSSRSRTRALPSTRTHLFLAAADDGKKKTKNWWKRSFLGGLSLDGGGSYNLKVDYDALDPPGRELADLAEQNKVVPLEPKHPSLREQQASASAALQVATFAGGCFWGLELAFQRQAGVITTIVGYTQGDDPFPNYEQVSAGNTGHTESVLVYFDPTVCSYDDLLDVFFTRVVDPTMVDGQRRDRGKQYRTGLYYHSESQQALAQARLEREASWVQPKRIATECRAVRPFWPAEPYHQHYLTKGGRFGDKQSGAKGCTDEIRCYG